MSILLGHKRLSVLCQFLRKSKVIFKNFFCLKVVKYLHLLGVPKIVPNLEA